MAANRDFKHFFETEPEELYAVLTGSKGKKGNIYGDIFGSLVERGAKGEAGLEHVQDFYQLMRGMLVNESVYMSVNHFVLPFQYQGKEAVSEFWIDPDAEKKEEEKDGGRIKDRYICDASASAGTSGWRGKTGISEGGDFSGSTAGFKVCET